MKHLFGVLFFLLALVTVMVPQTEPRVIVGWDPIPDPQCCNGYRIKWGTVTPLSLVQEVTGNVSAGTITGIDASTTYNFSVAGLDKFASQEGTYSTSVPFNFGWVQPANPTNLRCAVTGTGGTRNVTCSWYAVTTSRLNSKPLVGMTYTLERHLLSTTGASQTVFTGSTLSYVDMGLSKHKTFYYIVTAISSTKVQSYGSLAVRVQT